MEVTKSKKMYTLPLPRGDREVVSKRLSAQAQSTK